MRRQLKITALIVTHDAEEAAALADRIITLQAGRLNMAESNPDPAGVGNPARDPVQFQIS